LKSTSVLRTKIGDSALALEILHHCKKEAGRGIIHSIDVACYMQIARRSIFVGCNRLLPSALLLLILAGGCNRTGDEPTGPLTVRLMSTSIVDGVLNKAITCDGQGHSPQLSWSAPPPQSQSLALVVTDRDSPLGYNFVHWVIYNVAAGARELPAGVPAQNELPDGAEQGKNDNDKAGYSPPCPPGKSVHHYDFILYAVDVPVNLPSASKKQLLHAISGHVLARGELIGRYGR
jgi:Raf kinase inhibitor-like YbhB/YbcL family protein